MDIFPSKTTKYTNLSIPLQAVQSFFFLWIFSASSSARIFVKFSACLYLFGANGSFLRRRKLVQYKGLNFAREEYFNSNSTAK
jgi:hypothetical protein